MTLASSASLCKERQTRCGVRPAHWAGAIQNIFMKLCIDTAQGWEVHLAFPLVAMRSQLTHDAQICEIEELMRGEKTCCIILSLACIVKNNNHSVQISTMLPPALRPSKAYTLRSHHLICLLTQKRNTERRAEHCCKSKYLISASNFKSNVWLAPFVPSFLFLCLVFLPGSLIFESQ